MYRSVKKSLTISSSWGPVDDGKKMDGPGLLVKSAFEEGVKYVSAWRKPQNLPFPPENCISH